MNAKSKALQMAKKMKHPAEQPLAYKSDVEKGFNKGKSLSIPQVKSVLRHVDKDIKRK